MRKVLKFGGTSVGSAEALARAAGIIREELPRGGLVVVSALSGTTDALMRAVEAASRGEREAARERAASLWRRHLGVARDLGVLEAVEPAWAPEFQRLMGLLEGMGLLWEASPRARDAALAVGETLSARLLAVLLDQRGISARFEDVRSVMKTDGRHGRARPRLEALRQAAEPWRQALAGGERWITQGFLGAAPDGSTTTLGRGGSDTSATLLGEALNADEVQIWTDVDGVLTADPSLVPEARPIPAMSLREAAALSAFGAKVLHADALAPVARGGFRLVVANTHRPDGSRTVILREGAARSPGEITSVAYKEGVWALRLPPEGDLERLAAAASRLQEAGAARYGFLATPEGGLLLVRPETEAALRLVGTLAEEGLQVEPGLAVVALVGEGLREGRGRGLALLANLHAEPIAGLLAGDTGIALALVLPQERLPLLIPQLHRHVVEG